MQRYFDKGTADLLRQIVELRTNAAKAEQRIAQLQGERDSIHNEQKRIRENLQALGDRPTEKELRERFVRTLNSQEDQLQQRLDEMQSRPEAQRQQSNLQERSNELQLDQQQNQLPEEQQLNQLGEQQRLNQTTSQQQLEQYRSEQQLQGLQQEQQIDQLKYQKAALAPDAYKQQLAALLLELAKTQAELDK